MPKKPTTTSVCLRHPATYVFSFMANRYAIQHDAGFTVVHFGLLSKVNLLLDRFSCIIPDHTLKSQKENLLQYADKLGSAKTKTPTWVPPTPEAKDVLGMSVKDALGLSLRDAMGLPVVDFIHLCHWDDAYAEICFWNYSQASAADLAQMGSKAEMTPWGIALLRCGIDLQREFLMGLYEHSI